MITLVPDLEAARSRSQWFATTNWTVVLEAGVDGSSNAKKALETLCTSYWLPLYQCIRRSGYSPTDAQDLTQEFFARFIEKNYMSAARRERGRFRSFLLTCVQHFLTQEWRKSNRIKRGGRCTRIVWDSLAAQEQDAALESSHLSPAALYDQRWALTLLGRALNRLRDEFRADGKGPAYEALKQFLSNDVAAGEYGRLGEQLKLTTGAVAVFVCRLRKRYAELVREEVAQTVAGPEEIEEELGYLLSLVAR
jgi:RNA polymerase sigma-70 factor (ECF subfamily)